jgi:hypothetical protein
VPATPEHASDFSGQELHALDPRFCYIVTESDKLMFSTMIKSTHARHATMYRCLPHPVISPNLAETTQQENLTHSGECSEVPIGKGIMILTKAIKHRKETKVIKLERIVYFNVG